MQPQVSIGKRQQDRLLVLGGRTHSLVTSGISTGLRPVSSFTQNHHPEPSAFTSGRVRLGQPAGFLAGNVTCARDRKFNFGQSHTTNTSQNSIFSAYISYNFGSSVQT